MPRLIALLLLASCAKAAPVQAAPLAAVYAAPLAEPQATPPLSKDPLRTSKGDDPVPVGRGVAYLPPCVADLALGMPMAEVEPLHAMSSPDTLLDFRLQREQAFETGPVANVIYYFDGDLPGHPLYELIVEWRTAVERDRWVSATLGAPNAGDQWSIAGLDWPARAWVFSTRYVVAAAMPGTEWAE